MTNDETQFDTLRALGLLPSPQGVAVAIARMALQDEVATDELTQLIKTDPAMAGRLLRYANAAGAGSRRQIASLSQAVTFLGLYRIRQLALVFSLVDFYRQGRCTGFDYPRYWSESLATGVGAQTLCTYAQVPPEDAFTCGLLSSIGRLGLATAFPDDYAKILAQNTACLGDAALRAEERRKFSIDHAALSREMLGEWGLPSIFVDAAGFHEFPEEAPFAPGSRVERLTWMLHLSALIASNLARDGAERDESQSIFHAAARIGLDAGELLPTIERIESSWLNWGSELDLPTQAKNLSESLIDAPSSTEDSALVIAPMRVALIASDPALIEQLSCRLKVIGQEATLIDDWSQVAETLRVLTPDVLLVDPRGSDQSPCETVRTIRQWESGHRAVLVALLPAANEPEAPELIRGGADDYLLIPTSESALQARMHAAQRIVALQGFVRNEREMSIRHSSDWAKSNRRLLHDALSDALTQLPNRRYGLDHLAQELEYSIKNHLSLALIMIDIDHFKWVNDTWGHATGDEVLRQVASVMQASCRMQDLVFRYGGEEFCIVCPATGISDAIGLAERVLNAVGSLRLPVANDFLRVTVSAGVAVSSGDLSLLESLINAADAALYCAKKAGRNLVFPTPPRMGFSGA